MARKEFAPATPGEMLKEEFLAEYRLSQNQLAKNSPEFWMNLQAHYDLKMARQALPLRRQASAVRRRRLSGTRILRR